MPTYTPDVVAIDVLLDPDARMLARAEANDARLLKVFSAGFALDAAHWPHVTMLQCFVGAARRPGDGRGADRLCFELCCEKC